MAVSVAVRAARMRRFARAHSMSVVAASALIGEKILRQLKQKNAAMFSCARSTTLALQKIAAAVQQSLAASHICSPGLHIHLHTQWARRSP